MSIGDINNSSADQDFGRVLSLSTHADKSQVGRTIVVILFFLTLSGTGTQLAMAHTCESPPTRPTNPQVPQMPDEIKDEFTKYTLSAEIMRQPTTFSFGKFPPTAIPKKGTVIHLCGGPGHACLYVRPSNIPPDYEVVTVDYLGVGLNREVDDPQRLSIDAQAEMVIEIAKSLNEKSLYIQGISFGTAVATVAASKISNLRDFPSQLKGVILNGTVGRGNTLRYEDGYIRAAQAVWARMSPQQRQQMKTSYQSIISGKSEKQIEGINAFITSKLLRGTKHALQTFTHLNEDDILGIPEMDVDFSGSAAHATRVYDKFKSQASSGCQIYKTSRTQAKGSLSKYLIDDFISVKHLQMERLCRCKTVSKVFDPAEYKIKKTPIVYISGENDPATPSIWTNQHKTTQTETSHIHFKMPGGGHTDHFGPLAFNCTELFLSSLALGDLASIEEKRSSVENQNCGSSRIPNLRIKAAPAKKTTSAISTK